MNKNDVLDFIFVFLCNMPIAKYFIHDLEIIIYWEDKFSWYEERYNKNNIHSESVIKWNIIEIPSFLDIRI